MIIIHDYTCIGYHGDTMEVDPTPAGALGQMNAQESYGGDASNGYGFEDEPPLLEGTYVHVTAVDTNYTS